MTLGPSFRDPAGRLVLRDDRVLRAVALGAVDGTKRALATKAATRFIDEGRLVHTRVTDEAIEGAALVLEHERVSFPSFPYEWPAEMLHAAGELTLDLAGALLAEGFGLKDATPFNVLFRGTKPVFVDFLSIEPRHKCDPLWVAEGQFERTFLLPLIARAVVGLEPASIFLSRRDGLEPAVLARVLGPFRRLRPSLLIPVTLPSILASRVDGRVEYSPRQVDSPERAQYILRSTLRRLSRQLARFAPKAAASRWTDYSSAATGADVKRDRIESFFVERSPKRVLDLGCNDGVYSRLAARLGASVVAIDSDPAVIGALWRSVQSTSDKILPLIVDIARPTPAIGWRNEECASFLARARGAFDLLLMLALVHHLAIIERIPMAGIAELAAELTIDLAVVEWVGAADPMSERLARGRENLASLELSQRVFEEAFLRFFSFESSISTAPYRTLYFMRRRSS